MRIAACPPPSARSSANISSGSRVEAGKKSAKSTSAVQHARHLVDGDLQPVLEDLQQAFDLDEIVAFEGVHHLDDVVPHLGVHFAGAVAEQQRKIRLARFFLPNVFDVNEESGGENLVGL